MKYQTILFDMDGTILDTLEDLQSSVNHMREKYGYPPCSLDEVRRFVGNGARVLMRRALPELMTPEREDALLEEYKAWYMVHNCVRTHPYAGIPAKPAPDMVWAALEELGVPREGALYVGDSEVDVETARRSGLDLVGVSWGFRGRELLRQAGAEHIADSVQQLWEFVR